MPTQEIEFSGEYSINLGCLPVTVQKKGVSSFLIIVMYLTSLLAIALLSFSLTSYNLTNILKILAYYSIFFISLSLILLNNEAITIDKNKISYKKTIALVIPLKRWSIPLSEFSAILGKRYYSRLDGSTPLLVREVILHHSRNPLKYNIILARFVEKPDKYIFCQEIWAEYWYKACVLFEKKAINLVDKKKDIIDIAQIQFIEGDGGAIQY